MEKKCCLPFLDILLTRNGNNIVTTVYHKTTSNDLYPNWNSFAPTSWKRVTLKTLIDHAYLIGSSPELQKQEIQHLKQVFHEKNDYSKWVIDQVVEQLKPKHQTVTHSNNLPMDVLEHPSASNKEKSHLLLLPYQGQKGDFTLKLMRKRFKRQIAFKDKKLNVLKSKTQLILNINTILFIMENVLLIIVMMVTLVKQVTTLQNR